MRHRTLPTLLLTLGLALAACGGDDATDDTAAPVDEAVDTDADEAPAAGGGQDYGTVTLGDEVIALDGGFGCFDEEQEVVGSPGSILLNAVVTGTNAAGEQVRLDLTRFDEESLFTGDDVTLDIGELDMSTGELSGGSYTTTLDLGAAGDPPTLTADGFVWQDFESGEQLDGAFTITC